MIRTPFTAATRIPRPGLRTPCVEQDGPHAMTRVKDTPFGEGMSKTFNLGRKP